MAPDASSTCMVTPPLSATAFNGGVTMHVDDASGAIEELKSYGLPVMFIFAVFAAAIFELLRRLFRNVGRGESFTAQNVRLVQIIGAALIFYSFVSGVGESWFAQGMWSYLTEHMQIAVSGAPVALPPAVGLPPFGRFPFRSPPFYCGLLVLALAEVFRQGLVLKRDSDLTV